MKINIINVLKSLSKAQSVISPKVGIHQQQVAYLTYHIASQLNMTQDQKTTLLIAGLWHDIGALSLQEQEDAISEQLIDVNIHAFRGAYLISGFLPERNIARIIKYHHFHWEFGDAAKNNPDMPFESQLLHLADRVCSCISDSGYILSQVPEIKKYVKKNTGCLFAPEHAEAFMALAGQEALWLDIVSRDPIERIDRTYFASTEVSIDDLSELARIYSHLIDFRSAFTSTHSAGVANVAKKLAELMHFSSTDCQKMLIAGYLHDLGKLTVDNSILEKQAALDPEEFDVVRSHTYYTYYLLDDIIAWDEIKQWAAFHHERLNGKGYPFHLDEHDLPLGARIMAVADIFSALQEKRPYKEAMRKEEIVSILSNMVKNGSLDQSVVSTLEENYECLSDACTNAKVVARNEYDELYLIG